MDTRREEGSSLLAGNLVDTLSIPGGVRLVLQRSQETADAIERLMSLENSCCPWIASTVEGDRFLMVDATAEHGGGAAVLREWFGRRHQADERSGR